MNEKDVVIINTLFDIKNAIQEFTKKPQNPDVHTKMIAEDGKVWQLSAPTGCSYYDMMLEGFNIVKKRIEASEKFKSQLNDIGIEPLVIDGKMWLDDLITRRLGGTRDGLRVKWEIKEGIFYFDPFTGKLTKCQ